MDVCVGSVHVYASDVKNKVSYIYIQLEKPLNQGFFYISAVAVKFDTEFWVNYGNVKTSTGMKKKENEILYFNSVIFFEENIPSPLKLIKQYYTLP